MADNVMLCVLLQIITQTHLRYLEKTHTHTQMANKITDGRQCSAPNNNIDSLEIFEEKNTYTHTDGQ